MMKLTVKLLAGLASVLLLLGFTACSGDDDSVSNGGTEQTDDNSASNGGTDQTDTENTGDNATVKVTFSATKQMAAAQAATAIQNATEDTLIVLTDAASEDDIAAMKEALFALSETSPSVKIGIDFSGETETTARSATAARAVTGFTTMPLNAFYDENELRGTPNLRKVKMPKGMATIGRRAFKGCTGLEEIEIPESVTTIGENVCDECTSLTEVVIPEGVTAIKDSAFKGCTSLTKVTIPSTVTSIADEAFFNCDRLASVRLPAALVSIGDYAFKGCQSIKTISVPAAVTRIGKQAFTGTSLSTVKLYAGMTGNGYESGDLSSTAFSDCGTFDLIIAANGENGIGQSMCNGWTGIKSVEINEGVTSIDSAAFYYCTSIKSIEIPSSVKSIGSNAFCGCRKLVSITILEGVEKISGNQTFMECESLTEIVFPNSLTEIESGSWMFNKCSSLTSITFGGLPTIPSIAFDGCGALKKVCIPKTLQKINGAFQYSSLEEVIFEDGETEITLSSVDFYGSLYLSKITFGTRVRTLDGFGGCTGLDALEIPATVKTIKAGAFASCNYPGRKFRTVTFAQTSGWYYKDDAGNEQSADVSDPELNAYTLSESSQIQTDTGIVTVETMADWKGKTLYRKD